MVTLPCRSAWPLHRCQSQLYSILEFICLYRQHIDWTVRFLLFHHHSCLPPLTKQTNAHYRTQTICHCIFKHEHHERKKWQLIRTSAKENYYTHKWYTCIHINIYIYVYIYTHIEASSLEAVTVELLKGVTSPQWPGWPARALWPLRARADANAAN